MFFDTPAEPYDGHISWGRWVVLAGSVGFILLFIISPSSLLDICRTAAVYLIPSSLS
jgi:hypothetical protein